MKNFAKIVIFILISTLTFSCYKPLEFSEIDSTNIKLGNNQNALTITVKVKNPNFFKIKVVQADLNVYLNDKFFAQIKDDFNITISPNSNSEIDIPLNLDIGNLISNAGTLMNLFSNKDQTTYRITGTITGKTFFGKKKIPIDQQENIKKNN